MYPTKPGTGQKHPLITRRYGVPGPYIAGVHTGTDLGWIRRVEYVRASWLGKIVRVGRDAAYGKFVVIEHPDGSQSWYCHLAFIRPGIRVGKTVHTGRWLGIMGQTGNATGRHCHYEERDAPHGYFDHRAPKHFSRPVPKRLKGWRAA